jgi:phosphatidylglycerophosphate synthase
MTVLSSLDVDPRRAILRDLLLAFPAGATLAWIVVRTLDLSAGFPLRVFAVYASVGLLILLTRPTGFPGRGMGAANRVTLLRIVVALPVAGFALQGGSLGETVRWWIVGLGTIALVLDGVDGWVARRTGSGSDFGARFDMETDALLLLVLSVLAWRSGQVGAWVLGIGAMRYLFVAAGAAVERLRQPLPPSLRRKAVCVVQGIALLVCLGPIVPSDLARLVAGLALAALGASFALDTWWLMRSPDRDQASAGASVTRAA